MKKKLFLFVAVSLWLAAGNVWAAPAPGGTATAVACVLNPEPGAHERPVCVVPYGVADHYRYRIEAGAWRKPAPADGGDFYPGKLSGERFRCASGFVMSATGKVMVVGFDVVGKEVCLSAGEYVITTPATPAPRAVASVRPAAPAPAAVAPASPAPPAVQLDDVRRLDQEVEVRAEVTARALVMDRTRLYGRAVSSSEWREYPVITDRKCVESEEVEGNPGNRRCTKWDTTGINPVEAYSGLLGANQDLAAAIGNVQAEQQRGWCIRHPGWCAVVIAGSTAAVAGLVVGIAAASRFDGGPSIQAAPAAIRF
ncbi:MAG: hypothetical protein UX98_C0005G0044 [Parcubacteria group bacterium GW2011_GWA2_47_26]|nr:MAG: hypothetical protein UX98_C0005G0044 [Parcubacteria group bacterium GW2011_GWA2_47_26]